MCLMGMKYSTVQFSAEQYNTIHEHLINMSHQSVRMFTTYLLSYIVLHSHSRHLVCYWSHSPLLTHCVVVVSRVSHHATPLHRCSQGAPTSPHNSALLIVLRRLLGEPLFTELRTKRQLGYIVSLSVGGHGRCVTDCLSLSSSSPAGLSIRM